MLYLTDFISFFSFRFLLSSFDSYIYSPFSSSSNVAEVTTLVKHVYQHLPFVRKAHYARRKRRLSMSSGLNYEHFVPVTKRKGFLCVHQFVVIRVIGDLLA